MNDLPVDLSIIIPTLNEEKYIGNTLTHLYENLSDKYTWEILIIDNGSVDRTTSIAKGHIVSIYKKPEFIGKKYLSLNFGASQAKGKNLLFLDADCILPKHFDNSVMEILEKNSVAGGAFEFKMNGKGLFYRIIEGINRLRYRIESRYYGDQGIFCTKKAFDKCNGFPEKPIMEAAYFCDELSKVGKLKLAKSNIISSIRRFKKGGVLKVMAQDTYIWIQFLLGIDISRYATQYWQENKNRGSQNIQ